MLERLVCCVGPIKGGTTWLMWHLRHSPEVFFAPEKEIHYHYSQAFWPDGIGLRLRAYQLGAKLLGKQFWPDHMLGKGYRAGVVTNYIMRWSHSDFDTPRLLKEGIDSYAANIAWYRDYLNDPTDEAWYDRIFGGAGEKWPCDFSATTHMMGPGGWQKLKSSAKDARMIYFIRNPYDRLWSHAKSHADSRGMLGEFTAMSPAEKAAYMRRYHLHRHSLYASRIHRMRAVLGADKVLVLNFDDIDRAPEQVLSLVSDFLGIAPIPVKEDLHKRHAASPELPLDIAAMKPFEKAFEREITRLGHLGYDGARKWQGTLGAG